MPVVRIGRRANNDVVLAEPAVADYHAQLRWRNGAYHLQTLSRDKTVQVNRQPLTKTIPLRAGDLLQIGPVTMQIDLQL
jgi:pSer/pThr/pTyr-binding forkhead associated (FHA) protein